MGSDGTDELPAPMRAEVIAVGTELVQGLITDTNSAWISTQLAEIGIPTDFHTCVADDARRMLDVLKSACARSDLVIVTGGLGPTADDITREVVAGAAGRELLLHQRSLDYIAGLFAGWGRRMSQNNARQAYLPQGAEVIFNPEGTAPGFRVRIGRAEVMVFPGVPREMMAMFRSYATAWLKARQKGGGRIRIRRIHCFGPGESQVDQDIRHLMTPERNPNVGLLVSRFIITVKITARGADDAEVDALIEPTEREVRQILGEIVFGADDETMEEAAARELISRGLTVALAESCTGGLIARRLTNVSGISKTFLAGVVSYSNEAKCKLLGVPAALLKEHGAVSEQVAAAMAEGIQRITGADVALSVTGVAGPTGGTTEKPVGLIYMGLACDEGVVVTRHLFRGGRERIRVRTALTALDRLRTWARES